MNRLFFSLFLFAFLQPIHAQTVTIYECGIGTPNYFNTFQLGFRTSSQNTFFSAYPESQSNHSYHVTISSDSPETQYVFFFKTIPELSQYRDLTIHFDGVNNLAGDSSFIFMGTNWDGILDFSPCELVGSNPLNQDVAFDNVNERNTIIFGFAYSPDDTASFDFRYLSIIADTSSGLGIASTQAQKGKVFSDGHVLHIRNFDEEVYEVEIYNLAQQLVHRERISGNYSIEPDVSEGIYFVKLTGENFTREEKVFFSTE